MTTRESVDNKVHIANRLINEKSPYLLQHAHNPVDWFPWGEEAFAKATEENKPIFLSKGTITPPQLEALLVPFFVFFVDTFVYPQF